MSVEEDTELRDLVSQTLENNGVLAKIRAELRASVFLALEEQEASLCKTPFENKALKEYLKSPQAALGLCIVREFLEYLELDFTLSVYNTETSHGKGYEYTGRNKLVKDLQIKNLNGKKGPLLAHILQIAQESSCHTTSVKEEATHTNLDNLKQSPGEIPSNISLDYGIGRESPNVSSTPLDRTFTSDGTTVKGIWSLSSPSDEGKSRVLQPLSSESQTNSEQKVVSDSKTNAQSKNYGSLDLNPNKTSTNKNSSLAKDSRSIKGLIENHESSISDRKQNATGNHIVTQSSKAEGKNSMSSLNDLPPLDGLQGKRTTNNASGINFADLDLPDEYEEDFLSTDSSNPLEANSKSRSASLKSSNKQGALSNEKLTGKKLGKGSADKETADKGANSPIGSISEDIEEDTNSGLDDLLNSTTSTDHTVDATISHIQSNFADYIEKL